jgi:hypothetical protein
MFIKIPNLDNRKNNSHRAGSLHPSYSIPFSSDAYLAKIESEKRLTLITAWEESEKARAENR